MKALAQLTTSKTPHVASAALEALTEAAAQVDDDALQALASLARSGTGEKREKTLDALRAGIFRRPIPLVQKAKMCLTIGVPELAAHGAHQLAELGDLSALGTLQTQAARNDTGAQYSIAKTLARAKERRARTFLIWLFGVSEHRLIRRTVLWTLSAHAAEADVMPFLAKTAEEHPDLAQHMEAAPKAVQERVRWSDVRSTGEHFSESDCYQPVWNPSSQFLVMMLQSYEDKDRWHEGLRASMKMEEGRAQFLDALHKMTQFDDTTVSTMAKEALAYIDALKQEKSPEPKTATVEPTESGRALALPLAIGGAVVAVAIAALLLRRRPRRKS